jgi:hypothetical protein
LHPPVLEELELPRRGYRVPPLGTLPPFDLLHGNPLLLRRNLRACFNAGFAEIHAGGPAGYGPRNRIDALTRGRISMNRSAIVNSPVAWALSSDLPKFSNAFSAIRIEEQN